MYQILFLLIILFILYLINVYKNKKKRKVFINQIRENWGLPKKNSSFSSNIRNYFLNTSYKNAFHVITDREMSDLDLENLFIYLDRTTSAIGQQFLYYKLRVISSQKIAEKFNTLVNYLNTHKIIREQFQIALHKLNTFEAYDLEKIIHHKIIHKPTLIKYYQILPYLTITTIILGFLNPIFYLFFIPLFFINMIIHYKTKERILFIINSIDVLKKSIFISHFFIKDEFIQTYFEDLSFMDDLKKIKNKMSFIGFEKIPIEDPISLLIWLLIEILKISFTFETLYFYHFIDFINQNKKSIDKLFQFIGEIDTAISTASIKHNNEAICSPKFIDTKKIKIEDLTHPLIVDCVPNSIELDNSSMLLTGSNMSGKTTFIRSVAINTILAQTLNFCYAKSYMAPFIKVSSSIRISDDLLEDTSYFFKEVTTIKEFINTSQKNNFHLFILDEIFKGTNTIERISAGKAILSYLNSANNIVMVSTHDIELADLLKNKKYNLYHFSELIIENKLSFDYKLKKGILKTRNAIKVLELHNYPEEIIEDALITTKRFLK